MIQTIAGYRESADIANSAINKVISGLEITESWLIIAFDDGTGIKLSDEGQSCCEQRWMHTDDKLEDFIGAVYLGAHIADGESGQGFYDEVQESQFLIISTSIGEFTIVNYNEHNGYYGGFAIRVFEL